MKKILVSFSLLFFVSFCWAEENSSVEKELSRRLDSVQSSSLAEEERQKSVLKALASVSACAENPSEGYEEEYVWLEDLPKMNDFLSSVYSFDVQEKEAFFKKNRSRLISSGAVTFEQENKFPSWRNELKDLAARGIKYVYIGEHHGTLSIPAEVSSVLFSLKAANPQARILLASEFVESYFPTVAPVQFSKGEENASLSFGTKIPFKNLPEIALKIGIDVMGLDDFVVGYFDDKDTYYMKLGNSWVFFSTQDLQSFYSGYDIDEVEALHHLFFNLSTTDWGLKKRNEQWMRYLKAVEPYYDIIVVYGGKAHLTKSMGGPGVIELMGRFPHVQIDFTSQEPMPQSLQSSYEEQIFLPIIGGVTAGINWEPTANEINNYSPWEDEGAMCLKISLDFEKLPQDIFSEMSATGKKIFKKGVFVYHVHMVDFRSLKKFRPAIRKISPQEISILSKKSPIKK